MISVSTSPSSVPQNSQEQVTRSGHAKGKSEMYMSSRDWLKVLIVQLLIVKDTSVIIKISSKYKLFYYTPFYFTSDTSSFASRCKNCSCFKVSYNCQLLSSQRHGLKAKKLVFYDLLQTLTFKHCDGVVDIQMAPGALDSTDAVSNQVRLKFNFH